MRVAATGVPPRSRRKRAEGRSAIAMRGLWEKEEEWNRRFLEEEGGEGEGNLGLGLPLEKVGKEGMDEEMKGRCGRGRERFSSNIISSSTTSSSSFFFLF